MLDFANSPSYGVHNHSTEKPMVVQRQSHNPTLIPVIVIFLVLAYASVALRIWTRAHFLKRLGWDDYMIIATVVFFSVYCGAALAMFLKADNARGLNDLAWSHSDDAASLLIVTECFYILTMMALKLSLAIFFLRILVTRWPRWIIIITITLSTLFGVVYFFYAIFQCGYVSNIRIFIQRMVEKKCASKAIGLAMNYTYACLGTVSDWACVLVPIYILWESTMSFDKKLLVGGLVLFASLGSVASVIRMLYLQSITIPTGELFVDISKLSIWSTIEPGVGITVSSLATLRPLVTKVVEKTCPSSLARTSQQQPSSSDDTHTNMANHKRDESGITSSDTTMVPASPYRLLDNAGNAFSRQSVVKDKAESIRDIEAEMRSYGMSVPNHCEAGGREELGLPGTTSVGHERDSEKRVQWFESQRASRS